jgi:N-acetylglucosamine-6-phosphate deacetylase
MTSFAVMENCAVLIEDGLIADVFDDSRLSQKRLASDVEMIDVNDAIIAPGFIDTHIHGYGGHGTDDAADSPQKCTDSVLAMSRNLVKCGVTAFNPTLYPSEPEEMIQAVAAVALACGQEEGARIMGLHLEGPFISPGKLGVQKPDTLSPVDLKLMERLWKAAGGRIVSMTVAPELKNLPHIYGILQIPSQSIKKPGTGV